SIEAALQLDRAAAADVFFEHLSVVSDRFDRVVRPRLTQSKRPSISRNDTEQALDVHAVALSHRLEVARRDPEFFGVDEREDRPAQDYEEIRIVLAYEWCKRFARNLLGQNHEFGRARQPCSNGPKLGDVRGVGLAAAGRKRGCNGTEIRGRFENDLFQRQLARLKMRANRELEVGPSGDAKRNVGELARGLRVHGPGNQEALTDIEGDGTEEDGQRAFALQLPRETPRHDVDLIVFQKLRHARDLDEPGLLRSP